MGRRIGGTLVLAVTLALAPSCADDPPASGVPERDPDYVAVISSSKDAETDEWFLKEVGIDCGLRLARGPETRVYRSSDTGPATAISWDALEPGREAAVWFEELEGAVASVCPTYAQAEVVLQYQERR
jgi:hypothetical protein